MMNRFQKNIVYYNLRRCHKVYFAPYDLHNVGGVNGKKHSTAIESRGTSRSASMHEHSLS